MNEKGTTPQTLTEEQLAEIIRRLAHELSPRQIYLFGSHAYGRPTDESDVDLMIVVDEGTELSVDFLKRAYRCLQLTFLPIELHFRSENKFQRRGSVQTSLEHDIITKGRVLYAA